MVMWEYKVQLPFEDGIADITADELDIWGDQGWELVAVEVEYGQILVAVFKRPVTPNG